MRLINKLYSAAILIACCQPVCAEKLSVNIESNGAASDGKTLCTAAIQKTIDDCNQAGGGQVVIPAGKFLTGTIVLKSNVELHLQKDAVLLGSFDLKDYPVKLVKYRSYTDKYTDKSLIFAEDQENISITGSGTINFQGEKFPPSPRKNWYKTTPFGIRVTSCKNVRVTGVTLMSSAMWMQLYLNCDGVHVEGITVWNHARRCNDGIDIDSTRNVKILNCKIDTLDDGICMKSTGPDPTENVVVSNCVVSSRCNALKTGTESTGGFKNILFTHCKIVPSKGEMHMRGHEEKGIGGVCIGCVDGGVMENITVDNITIEGTLAPLFLRLGQRNRRYHPDVEIVKDSTMKNITFSNITATGGSHNWGCAFIGLTGNPIKGLKLSNINIESPGGGTKEEAERVVPDKVRPYPQATWWGKMPAYGFFIRNVDDVQIDNVRFTTIQKDERPAFVLDEVYGAVARGIHTENGANTPIFRVKENCKDIDLSENK
jgi:polygalacturonase